MEESSPAAAHRRNEKNAFIAFRASITMAQKNIDAHAFQSAKSFGGVIEEIPII
jgi:hypothetical protein